MSTFGSVNIWKCQHLKVSTFEHLHLRALAPLPYSWVFVGSGQPEVVAIVANLAPLCAVFQVFDGLLGATVAAAAAA